MLENAFVVALALTLVTMLVIYPTALIRRYSRTPGSRRKPLGFVLLAFGLEALSMVFVLEGADELGLIAVDRAWFRAVIMTLASVGLLAGIAALGVLPSRGATTTSR
jgi:hypothetical protein